MSLTTNFHVEYGKKALGGWVTFYMQKRDRLCVPEKVNSISHNVTSCVVSVQKLKYYKTAYVSTVKMRMKLFCVVKLKMIFI